MSLPNLKFSDRDDDGLGPLRPDLLDLSDIEESDDEGDLLDDLQDAFIEDELNQFDKNVLSTEEEDQIFQNTISIEEGSSKYYFHVIHLSKNS